MKRTSIVLFCGCALFLGTAHAEPLLPESVIAALDAELSGETAKRNLEAIARHHRTRASQGFRAAAEHVALELRRYGLADVRILEYPADGRTMFGTQKSRPSWDADFAELWELRKTDAGWEPLRRLASWDAMPVTLAQDSESAAVEAGLVDVGAGTSDGDYEGKNVRGNLVLTSSQPREVVPLAVDRYGAVGVVSYAQNQRTAWWKENDNLVRWGHLDSFTPTKTFGFMVSLRTARAFRERLAAGEEIRLRAEVRATRMVGAYSIVTASIPGADLDLRKEEIAFSCHLDHQRPGANDNASGCSAILEAARTLAHLIDTRKIPRPARTLRFIWPPEIEGTSVLLNARPETAAAIRAVVHMDMVGGGPETKAIFHVTRNPASLPSFVNDVAESVGRFVNRQSDELASGGDPPYPVVAPEGGKEALQAEMAEFSMGSDHQVYADGSWGIPAVYLNDWPDRYIHTNFDRPANIDPTKLKRAAFIGAATAWVLAGFGPEDVPATWGLLRRGCLERTARMLERREGLARDEADNLTRFHWRFERSLVDSIERFAPVPREVRKDAEAFFRGLERVVGDGGTAGNPGSGEGARVYRRNPEIRGPMRVFGYDYLEDHLGAERTDALRLLDHEGLRGDGGAYAYEVLNFVDGRRTVREVRDAVSAEFGPVPLDFVAEYLRALESIEVVRPVSR